jgi:vanillate O-demethylase ferredoxin subunit|tara:strand:+ start:643 stop:924 length:282 start_codon:yes stop_codon:yes gene_type:complete
VLILSEGIKVKLARSNKTIFVEQDSSILFALLDAGVDLPFSCGSGLCGSCEVDVISGVPEHKDFVLTEEERASNKTMMICCSGALTEEIELDI